MNEQNSENKSAAVPEAAGTAKQAEDSQGRWSWVERSVWSERMLQALEAGLGNGKWYSLIDKVWQRDNLSQAWAKY